VVAEFWIQIENQAWDLAPNRRDRMTSEWMKDKPGGQPPTLVTMHSPVTGITHKRWMYKPMTDALIFRRYTENWAKPDDRKVNPWDINEKDPTDKGTMGTIPGAVIDFSVGDSAVIHFRNMDQRRDAKKVLLPALERAHSIHPHGIVFGNENDGAYPLSPPSTDPANAITSAEQPAWQSVGVTGKQKLGDRVPPGGTFTYTWNTFGWPTTAGVWLYHDHSVCDDKNVLRGAIGIIVVHNTNDPEDFVAQDLPDGEPNGSPIHTRCLSIRPEITFLPHDLGRLAVRGDDEVEPVPIMEMPAEEMAPTKKSARPKGKARLEAVDESMILRFGDLGLRVNQKLEAIDGLCISSFRTPPEKALYLQLYHELQGMGMCINGRQWLGNTPTVVAGRNTLMRFGLVAMNEATFHTFHLHGHRWVMPGPVGTDRSTIQSSAQISPVSQFEDTRIFGPANSFFFAIKEGDSFMRAEPPKGEWHMHCHVLGHMMEGMMGSLLVVDEDDIFTTLPLGKPCPKPMAGGDGGEMPGMGATVHVKYPNFNPGSVAISAGSAVTWINDDTFGHTATSDVGGIFDITLPGGGSGSHTFAAPGTFPYHCNAHPEMPHATVVVT